MDTSIFKKIGINDFKLKLIKSDASFRKYFRVYIKNQKQNLLFVNSPKKTENNLGYLKTTNIFEKINLSVPKIINFNISKGLFLIEDFGINTYTNSLKKGESEYKLYNLATDILIYINNQSKNLKKKLPQYTNKKLIEEVRLFLEWYWPAIYKSKPKKDVVNEFIKIWNNLLNKNLTTNKVLVHRDFHIDNLFFLKDRKGLKACGLIDFQDAVIGPSSYDLVSLLEDARRNVNKEVIFKMYNKFVKKLSKEQKENFVKEYKILATNRHLKVIGIFTRLYIRDKKKLYLKHIPRLWKLIEYNLNFYSLSELNKWINEFFPKKFRIKPKL